jgi:hypothetical protein
MGRIQNPTHLEQMCRKFEIKNYVETGVGKGHAMKYVLDLGCIDQAYGIFYFLEF